MRKPHPEIYQLILDRYSIEAETAIFIDDSLPNVAGSEALGITGIHFSGAQKLRTDLQQKGVRI